MDVCGGWGWVERRINELQTDSFNFELFQALEDGVHGLFGEAGEAGAGAGVGAFGGGGLAEVAEGEAEVVVVEFKGPAHVAGAEDAEVVDPEDAVGAEEDALAEDGVGVEGSDGMGVGDGAPAPLWRHLMAGGVVAPVAGAGQAEGRGSEGGLHSYLLARREDWRMILWDWAVRRKARSASWLMTRQEGSEAILW